MEEVDDGGRRSLALEFELEAPMSPTVLVAETPRHKWTVPAIVTIEKKEEGPYYNP